jgi:hypothetical protein
MSLTIACVSQINGFLPSNSQLAQKSMEGSDCISSIWIYHKRGIDNESHNRSGALIHVEITKNASKLEGYWLHISYQCRCIGFFEHVTSN